MQVMDNNKYKNTGNGIVANTPPLVATIHRPGRLAQILLYV